MSIKEVYKYLVDRANYAHKELGLATQRKDKLSEQYWTGCEMAFYDCMAMLEKTAEINPTDKMTQAESQRLYELLDKFSGVVMGNHLDDVQIVKGLVALNLPADRNYDLKSQ